MSLMEENLIKQRMRVFKNNNREEVYRNVRNTWCLFNARLLFYTQDYCYLITGYNQPGQACKVDGRLNITVGLSFKLKLQSE